MFLDKVLYFLTEYTEQNRIGNNIKKYSKRKVFCSEKSVGQNQFYQAQMIGLEPAYVLVIRPFEYKNERLVEYNGIMFKILKVFKKSSTELELTLEAVKIGE